MNSCRGAARLLFFPPYCRHFSRKCKLGRFDLYGRQTMPIPAFDALGNLDVGDYISDGSRCLVPCTLSEIKARFVTNLPNDTDRAEIWEGWMRYRREFLQFGLNYVTWVNGSFTTTKVGPDDVDLVILMDGLKVDALKPADQAVLYRLADPDHAKPLYRCHPFLVPWYPFDHKRFRISSGRHSYLTRVFGIAKRTNTPKAILSVDGAGVI